MASVLDSLPHAARVSVIRLRSLGDCVLTTPALRLLKQYRPDLSLAVVAEPRFHAVFEGNPDLDEVLAPSFRQLLRFRSTLCVNLHGGSTSAQLCALSGARYRAGFIQFRHRYLYNVRIPRAQQIFGEERTFHTAEHLASSMFYLGVPRTVVPAASLFTARTSFPRNFPGPYAVLHPVASQPAKTWPAESFLALAQYLRDSMGLHPVFLGGPGDDLSPFRNWATITDLPLSGTKQLLRDATLFIGNDSGPAHMAAAFQVPPW